MSFSYEFTAQQIIDEGRTTREVLDEIKSWLNTTNYPQIPEELIVLFLLSCQNVIVDTQNTIKSYFKIKNESPEIFTCRDVDNEELAKACKVVNCISFPKRLENNTVIHYFSLKDTNYQNFEWIAGMKLAYMILDISQRSNPPNQLVVIIDMKGLGFMHLTRLKLGATKKFLEFLQEAMPLKIKTIHILNCNYIFDKLLAIARVFIKNELMSIMQLHPPSCDMTQFYKNCVPASDLPKDYGGELPSLEELNEECVVKLRDLKPFFEAEEKVMRYGK